MSVIVDLRLGNWKAQQLINSTKETTAKTKHEADTILLDIQNIYYQHKHLNREIDQCESFVSKHEQLDLVPLEQFLEENPHLKEEHDKNPASRNVNHMITLERLKDEEKRRLELFVTKTRLHETRNKLNLEIKSLRDGLDDVKAYETQLKRLKNETDQLRKLVYEH
ncbi:hypothetical protein AWJ20_5061 [Sugiyamaella lignohabitans]|uniref:Uncharacterized protein n=1 Tax=Sugiyamaella lignohabitans TaxID=796027 RepID=A0A167EHV5_9ASCO|nr:uncharacterized protein AWJ20_5061 [Sugiyamaella lignohabitans]ANB14103.1 hypothetical protein AWJ20_5061 [Sugiyamaella lignohabitans]